MNTGIRLFVAATLPESLKDVFHEQLKAFEHPNIRFLPPQNLHLTLFFIGNVPLSALESIKSIIKGIAQQHEPFTLRFAQTEPGPHIHKPRLIWARFASHPTFEQLNTALTELLTIKTLPKKKPLPHITLARFRKDKPVPKELSAIISKEPIVLTVNTISLWQSELSSPHPTYKVLHTYPLGQNQSQ
jgi:RNA 2',3'-cyclic 3'-phosphodiesterase